MLKKDAEYDGGGSPELTPGKSTKSANFCLTTIGPRNISAGMSTDYRLTILPTAVLLERPNESRNSTVLARPLARKSLYLRIASTGYRHHSGPCQGS